MFRQPANGEELVTIMSADADEVFSCYRGEFHTISLQLRARRGMAMTEEVAMVWVFHGEGARFASGVFRTRDEGMAWIAEHRLTGLLTEYPLGVGCYDDAVARGLFRPSREHHGTPEHIAQYSPGRTEHIHVADGEFA